MKDGFTRLVIFLVIFTAGLAVITVTGSERLAFDNAKIEARSFLHTVCRMGEVSEASYSSFINSLPHVGEIFDVRISCPGKSDKEIREELSVNGGVRFRVGEEIMLEMYCEDHSFLCRGRVNGKR